MTRREEERRQAGIEKRTAIRRHLPIPEEGNWRNRKRQREVSRRLMIILLGAIFIITWQQAKKESLLQYFPLDQVQDEVLRRTATSDEVENGINLITFVGENYLLFVPKEGEKFQNLSAQLVEKELILAVTTEASEQTQDRKLYRISQGLERITLIQNGTKATLAARYNLHEEEMLPEISSETRSPR